MDPKKPFMKVMMFVTCSVLIFKTIIPLTHSVSAVELDRAEVVGMSEGIENGALSAFRELVEDIKEERTDDIVESVETVEDAAPVESTTEEILKDSDEIRESAEGLETVLPEVSDEVMGPVIEEVVEPDIELRDNVPFDVNLQKHVLDVCEEYGVDPALVYAVIERESHFDPNAVGTASYTLGLMQVDPYWNRDRMAELNCYDLFDPYQNIRVGVHLLAELFSEGYSIEGALMSFNMGRYGAQSLIEQGIVSEYASSVIAMRERY